MDTNRNKGGRPHTNRVNRTTIKLSNEAVALLSQQPNKSKFIDALIKGEVAQVKCPNCGKVLTIKKKD